MKEKIKFQIEKAINNGYIKFISGMALGFDMICAEQVLEFKKKYSQIILECALPCKTQSSLWQFEQQKRYNNIIKQANSVRYAHNEYVNFCMLERNRYMVDNSSLCIALFNGVCGGTLSTINYAKKQNVKVVIIKP